MKGFPVRPVPVENVGVAAKAVARRQAEQLTVVRRRAQPTAVYVARLTATAVFAYLIAQALPGGSPRDVVAPLTALLVAQATLFHTIGSAIRRVAAVTALGRPDATGAVVRECLACLPSADRLDSEVLCR